jgi:chromatin remodeling complex protein RSC6
MENDKDMLVKNLIQDAFNGVKPRREPTVERLDRQLHALSGAVSAILKDFKVLQRDIKKYEQSLLKKKEQQSKPKVLRGFQQPVIVSNELCDLLGLERGVSKTRNEVRNMLCQYIKAHGLEDPTDRRKINPDVALSAIFDIQPGEQPTYFNIQTFIKHHFRRIEKQASNETCSDPVTNDRFG